MKRTLTILLAALALSACRGVGVRADRTVYDTSDAQSPPLDAVEPLDDGAPPEEPGGLTEPERRKWLEEHPDIGRHIPSFELERAYAPRPAREREWADDDGDSSWWVVPLAVGAGYGLYRWKRHYDHHHGGSHWGVSIGSGWWGPRYGYYDAWYWR